MILFFCTWSRYTNTLSELSTLSLCGFESLYRIGKLGTITGLELGARIFQILVTNGVDCTIYEHIVVQNVYLTVIKTV